MQFWPGSAAAPEDWASERAWRPQFGWRARWERVRRRAQVVWASLDDWPDGADSRHLQDGHQPDHGREFRNRCAARQPISGHQRSNGLAALFAAQREWASV